MNREIVGGVSTVDRTRNPGGSVKTYLAFLFMAFFAMFLPNWAAAAAPPAGAVIGNQATASYTDAGGTPRTTTSNLVETTILPVQGVDVQNDQAKTAAPGSTVYLPHTIINTGNASDTFNLTTAQVTGGAYNFTNIVIYADANGDGVPDNFTPLTNVTLTANGTPGDTTRVVIAATVPTSAANNTQSQLTIKATSQTDGTVTDTNTDTVKITTNANVPVNKSFSVQSGPADKEVVVTLTYTNNGAKTATNLSLTDSLDSRFTYVPGTGIWSGSPTALNDSTGANDPAGIDYNVNGQVVTASIASVEPGQSGFVKFTVRVKPDVTPGSIPNTAGVTYADGGGNTVTTNTNTTSYTVTPTVSVRLSDINSTTDTDGQKTEGNSNDVVTAGTATQGASVIFDNVVKNTGNGTDTFNVIYDTATSNFPAGTSFQLLRVDDTPMTDSNGDGIVDTGPIAAGAEFNVHLRVNLPINASGGPYSIQKKATSVSDPTKSDTVTDTLLLITGNTVDLTNNQSLSENANAPGKGVNAQGEAAPVTTVPVNPGQSADFTLVVNNTSTVSDSYNLAGSTDKTFASITLPAGWTLTFRNAATNAVISNTGSIAPGSSLKVIATVTVPVGQTPTTQNIYFRSQSPTSGALDVKNDAVVVNQAIDASVTPNNSSTGFAGGSVVYKHTLSNNGNTDIAAAPLTVTNSDAQWTTVLWYDADNSGTVSAGDIQVSDVSQIPGGLPAGSSKSLLAQVFIPSGANDGATNTTTVTVNATGDAVSSNNAATDITTVQSGNVQLTKRQALDAACDGTADGAFVSTVLQAKPGQCLVYQLTLTNLSTGVITNTKISDATPSFTTYLSGFTTITPAGTLSEPANGSAGTVSATVPSIGAGASAVLTFPVKIQQ